MTRPCRYGQWLGRIRGVAIGNASAKHAFSSLQAQIGRCNLCSVVMLRREKKHEWRAKELSCEASIVSIPGKSQRVELQDLCRKHPPICYFGEYICRVGKFRLPKHTMQCVRASVECINLVRDSTIGAVLADPHLCMHMSMNSFLDVYKAHMHAHVQRHVYAHVCDHLLHHVCGNVHKKCA